jgi:hypothetical protein
VEIIPVSQRTYVAADSRFRTAKKFVNDLQLIAAAKLPAGLLAGPTRIQIVLSITVKYMPFCSTIAPCRY